MPKAKTKKTEVTAVAKRGEFAILGLEKEMIQEIIANNLGSQTLTAFDLDRVRVPSGGANHWSIPSLEGEQSDRELVGVAIHHRSPRAYWKQKFEGQSNPPDCTSPDVLLIA